MSYDVARGEAARRQISAAQAAAVEREQRAAYAEYRAEARACGYEVESFKEFIGEVDPKAEAYDRVHCDWYDNDLARD